MFVLDIMIHPWNEGQLDVAIGEHATRSISFAYDTEQEAINRLEWIEEMLYFEE